MTAASELTPDTQVRPPTFGAVASTLVTAGYEPIPIRWGKKSPGLNNWQRYRYTDADAGHYAGWGVGILTAQTPAVDVDVRDAIHGAALNAILVKRHRWAEDGAARAIAAAPVRVGAAPKFLRPYRLDGEPFPKLTTREFVLPGDDINEAGYRPHKVEILGDGPLGPGLVTRDCCRTAVSFQADSTARHTSRPASMLGSWIPGSDSWDWIGPATGRTP
jgi:hypothetical protein